MKIHTCVRNTVLEYSIGTKYAYLDQNYKKIVVLCMNMMYVILYAYINYIGECFSSMKNVPLGGRRSTDEDYFSFLIWICIWHTWYKYRAYLQSTSALQHHLAAGTSGQSYTSVLVIGRHPNPMLLTTTTTSTVSNCIQMNWTRTTGERWRLCFIGEWWTPITSMWTSGETTHVLV